MGIRSFVRNIKKGMDIPPRYRVVVTVQHNNFEQIQAKHTVCYLALLYACSTHIHTHIYKYLMHKRFFTFTEEMVQNGFCATAAAAATSSAAVVCLQHFEGVYIYVLCLQVCINVCERAST